MDINALLVGLANTIAKDTDIKSWMQEHYDVDHRVYVGIDTREPPGMDDCPYYLIYPVRKTVGQHRSEKFHEFEVVSCIYDENTNPHLGIPNLTEYSGIQNIETMRKLAEISLAAYNLGNATIETIIADYAMIESFPFFLCGMVLSIWEAVTIGSDPLL